MSCWQVEDVKARFSELLDATIKNGPQVVTRRGIETAVLVQFKSGGVFTVLVPALKSCSLVPGLNLRVYFTSAAAFVVGQSLNSGEVFKIFLSTAT